MKYYLDINGNNYYTYTLKRISDDEIIAEFNNEDCGIESDSDDMFQDKIDMYLVKEFGINDSEWEIG